MTLPDRLAALISEPDPVVIETRRITVKPERTAAGAPAWVLVVTIDGRCEHWGDDDEPLMMWSALELWLDVWPGGEVTTRCLLTAHMDPVVPFGPGTSPSTLVAGAVRSMRDGTPGHWRCRSDRAVPALLAVLGAAQGWDDDRVQAERVLAAFAMARL
jgi:hypothetical protein